MDGPVLLAVILLFCGYPPAMAVGAFLLIGFWIFRN
jgi:hypothetical protein